MSQRSKDSVSSLGSFDPSDEKIGFERRYQNQFALSGRGDVNNGNGGIGERGGFGGYREVGNVSPLSPLPRAKIRDEGEVYVDGVGFDLVPRSPMRREERVELQGEEIKGKVFELA